MCIYIHTCSVHACQQIACFMLTKLCRFCRGLFRKPSSSASKKLQKTIGCSSWSKIGRAYSLGADVGKSSSLAPHFREYGCDWIPIAPVLFDNQRIAPEKCSCKNCVCVIQNFMQISCLWPISDHKCSRNNWFPWAL